MVFDLFMTIITQCEVDDPGELWEQKKEYIMEKFFRKQNCTPSSATIYQREQCYQECLREIKTQLSILLGGGKKVSNKDLGIPEPEQHVFTNTPKIIIEELAYDTEEQLQLNDERAATLKEDQKKVSFFVHFTRVCLRYHTFFLIPLFEKLISDKRI